MTRRNSICVYLRCQALLLLGLRCAPAGILIYELVSESRAMFTHQEPHIPCPHLSRGRYAFQRALECRSLSLYINLLYPLYSPVSSAAAIQYALRHSPARPSIRPRRSAAQPLHSLRHSTDACPPPRSLARTAPAARTSPASCVAQTRCSTRSPRGSTPTAPRTAVGQPPVQHLHDGHARARSRNSHVSRTP